MSKSTITVDGEQIHLSATSLMGKLHDLGIQGSFDQLIKIGKTALPEFKESDHDSAEIHRLIARAYQRKAESVKEQEEEIKHYQHAVRHLNKGRNMAPHSSQCKESREALFNDIADRFANTPQEAVDMAARINGDDQRLPHILSPIANHYSDKNEQEAVIIVTNAILERTEEISNSSVYQSRAIALTQKANAQLALNDQPAAIETSHQLIAMADTNKEPQDSLRNKCVGLMNIGRAQSELGRHDEALATYEQYEETARAFTDHPTQQHIELYKALSNKADLLIKMDRPEDALEATNKSLEHAKALEDAHMLGIAYRIKARIHYRQNNPTGLHETADDLEKLAQSYKETDQTAYTKNLVSAFLSRASAYAFQGDVDKAYAQVAKLNTYQSLESRTFFISTLANIEKGSYTQALSSAEKLDINQHGSDLNTDLLLYAKYKAGQEEAPPAIQGGIKTEDDFVRDLKKRFVALPANSWKDKTRQVDVAETAQPDHDPVDSKGPDNNRWAIRAPSKTPDGIGTPGRRFG